jgi:lipid II:glycine glycyltransferase (peptidoglycan interpeptide bridge formation enzyme)
MDCGGGSTFVEDALDHLMQVWREMGVVSVFTRFCPFHENHSLFERWLESRPHASGSVESNGHIVVIDVTQTPEQRWQGFKGSLRRDIRRAEEFGLRAEPDPDWERLEDFLAIYESVGQRNEFAVRHLLHREQFLAMRDSLGSHAVMFHVMDRDRVAASAVWVASGGVLHGLFGGPHPDYLRFGAYKFLIYCAVDWAREQGLRYLNVGGGRGGSDTDSLYQFKRAFSNLRLPFHVGRLILDAAKYDELTLMQGLQANAHFFPAYRASGLVVEKEDVTVDLAHERASRTSVGQEADTTES